MRFAVVGASNTVITLIMYALLVAVGVPIYFLDSGALVGVHGAVGAEWNLSPHAGVLLEAGVQYYFSAPMGIVDVAFVPSVAFNYRR